MNISKDTFRFGLTAGLIAPLVVILVYLLYNFEDIAIYAHFFDSPWRQTRLFKLVISLCIIPDLILFFAFYQKESNLSAKGVIMPTYIFTLIAVLLKFS